ncbi:peroxiredoxin family protein [Ferruginibacter sp. SUN002]|uniref:peroxiredoxin family protein n=1 Tax=Ferruginibacter sp. SUN002 TaxID=2937789 RepID=UPI003D35FBB7
MKKIFAVIAFVLFAQFLFAQVGIGGAAPEISLPNTKDSIINLSSLKGKIVLLDFWASWCVPCRKSNRELGVLYKKYKEKGFEVYAVSLDHKESDWKKAIKKDNITYAQVNDKQGVYSKIADTYGVSEIPSSFLIDTDGTILAINLETKELQEMLDQLLQR